MITGNLSWQMWAMLLTIGVVINPLIVGLIWLVSEAAEKLGY